MTQTFNYFSAILFWSCIVGITISILLYCPLIYNIQQLLIKNKRKKATEATEETMSAINVNVVNFHQNVSNNLCNILLLSSLGCVTISLLFLILLALFSKLGNKFFFNITETKMFCEITMNISSIIYQLSRYCFYIFMLQRIKISFTAPIHLKLSDSMYKANLIWIHLNLLFGCTVTILVHYKFDQNYQECMLSMTNVTTLFAVIVFVFDTLYTILLLYMFLKRMCQLTKHNEKVNSFIWRVLISGIIATSSSLVIVICLMIIGNKAQCLAPIDQTINSICVVATYKPRFIIWNLSFIKDIESTEEEDTQKIEDDIQELMDLFDENGNLSLRSYGKDTQMQVSIPTNQ
eukprot:178091_1